MKSMKLFRQTHKRREKDKKIFLGRYLVFQGDILIPMFDVVMFKTSMWFLGNVNFKRDLRFCARLQYGLKKIQ